MTALNGKWKLVSTSKLEEYHAAINTPEAYRERLRKLAEARKTDPDCYFEEFHVDPAAGTVRRQVNVNKEVKRDVTYKIGPVNDGTAADGRPMKVTVGLVGDSKVTIHEEGSGVKIDGFIEAKGSQLTISLSSGGVTSTETYSKI